MAEQQAVPTFKLVLVGDGGTGKVSVIFRPLLERIRTTFCQPNLSISLDRHSPTAIPSDEPTCTNFIFLFDDHLDHIRQAPFDW